MDHSSLNDLQSFTIHIGMAQYPSSAVAYLQKKSYPTLRFRPITRGHVTDS